ncbi:MAG: cellulose-binding protein, partial [Nonomuraea sp.]|nr:cellulose-binding protein [Nonomuraea sp.]
MTRRPPIARFWAVVVCVVLAGGVAVAAPAVAASLDAGCRVDYTVNQWQGGFTAQVKVTNLGAALNGWRLRWTYADGQKVTSAWNAQVDQSGTAVTATNVAWNAAIPSNGSAEFGLQGTWTSANPVPAAFALNDTTCDGTVQPSQTPTVTPTITPTVTPTVTPTADPGCTSGAAVCSGFEDQTGTTPSGDWQVVTPNCAGTGTATIDTATAHSGSRSLRITGGAGYCNHVFAATTRDVSRVGPVVYARMWV